MQRTSCGPIRTCVAGAVCEVIGPLRGRRARWAWKTYGGAENFAIGTDRAILAWFQGPLRHRLRRKVKRTLARAHGHGGCAGIGIQMFR